jgi:hypothetical protein
MAFTEIDLGADTVIKVKWRGQEYSLREPTVRELEQFKESNKDESSKVFEFVEMLGMPKGVIDDMPASKAKHLFDGLLGAITQGK